MTAEKSTAFGAIITNAPNPVATPLPPRKFSQMGNMWPATANNAAKAAPNTNSGDEAGIVSRHGMRPIDVCPRIEEFKSAPHTTAIDPFSASSNRVKIPRPGDLRATLVAPMLPLPVRRTSSPRKIRIRR